MSLPMRLPGSEWPTRLQIQLSPLHVFRKMRVQRRMLPELLFALQTRKRGG